MAAAALWPASVETDYYAADVRLSPAWENHSTIGSDTVVGNVSAEFAGVAPGIRVEPRIKPEITDLVESGNLGLSTLVLDDGSRAWNHEVALIVIDRHYEPHTDLPTPTGNAVMVEPSDEVSYLASLDNIGYVVFMPNPSAD